MDKHLSDDNKMKKINFSEKLIIIKNKIIYKCYKMSKLLHNYK